MKSNCIEHDGCITSNGYGKVGTRKYGTRVAHRVAWIEANGEIPEGMVVMHKCDNRKCVNLDHLQLGTQKDNIQDMFSKGREVRYGGDSHWNSKLTSEDIPRVRDMLRLGVTQARIAEWFGVTRSTISDIKTGKRWSNIS